MSDILAARCKLSARADELRQIGEASFADQIIDIVTHELKWRKAARRTPKRSQSMTPAIRSRIHPLAGTTSLSSSEIAALVKVNPGRIFETINP